MEHVNEFDQKRRSKSGPSVQAYARIAGLLFLLTLVFGFFGEAYVPSKVIVSVDTAATAHNIRQSDTLVRLGFACYLVEAICDISLAWIFYVLLRPVHRDLAMLAAFFGLVSTAVYAVAELFFFAATFILRGGKALEAFSPEQLNALAMLSLKFFGYGSGLFMAFYGIATLLRGYLISRSRYLPRTLGALMIVAGTGFIAKNFALVLAPAYASDLLLLPMFVTGLVTMVWLVTKGIDIAEWRDSSDSTTNL